MLHLIRKTEKVNAIQEEWFSKGPLIPVLVIGWAMCTLTGTRNCTGGMQVGPLFHSNHKPYAINRQLKP